MTPPILGIWASQISGHLGPGVLGAYDALATITVPSAGATSVEFVGLPTGYKHLQIRMMARSNIAAATDQFKFTFNGDTSASYAQHLLQGNGSSAGSFADPNLSFFTGYQATASTAGANTFGVAIADILDYSSISKTKTTRFLGGQDNNGSGLVALASGLWNSTAAISSIKIAPQSGTGWLEYSQFALYGVK